MMGEERTYFYDLLLYIIKVYCSSPITQNSEIVSISTSHISRTFDKLPLLVYFAPFKVSDLLYFFLANL